MRYITWTALAMILVPVPALAASSLVFINGHIYTANPASPWAQAIAIGGSRIQVVGTSNAVRKATGPRAVIVDLKGRTVIPGIIDGHTHTLYGSLELAGANLSTPERSITPDNRSEFVAFLKRYSAEHPKEKIIFGRADFSTTPPGVPSHEMLDEVATDRPVIVRNTSEHAVWLNATAIRLAGLTDYPLEDAAEEKGVIRDASGHPSGVLLEAATRLVDRATDHHVNPGRKARKTPVWH